MQIRLKDFVAETFRPYVETSFSFRLPERPETMVQLKLQDVRAVSASFDLKGRPATVRQGGFFSLLFVAEAETTPASGLYQLDHPGFEPVVLLLSRVSVPSCRPENPPIFEAVFG
jgi:hypothetical protein